MRDLLTGNDCVKLTLVSFAAARIQVCAMRGSNLNLAFGLKTIYEDAEFSINKRDKVGIVGVNGAGKTTLFRIILGKQKLDSGRIAMGNARIGYLPQEIVLENPNMTVLDYLLDGRPIPRLEAELQQIYQRLENARAEDAAELASLLARMGKVQEMLEHHDCYEAENILLRIIDNMGIDADLLDKRLVDLSGGQKSKIAFACVLYSNPEILLLDEPTNHLDVSTKAFVTGYLKEYDGTVLIISHDIGFLNVIINRVMHINKMTHKISMYDGDYTAYCKKYALEQRLREQLISRQEAEIKEMADLVQRAKEASPTNHRLKSVGLGRAAKLEKKQQELLQRELPCKRMNIRLMPHQEDAKTPLEVQNLSFAYPASLPIIQNLSFALAGKERFLVVGENGAGKSTLLKLIMGILSPHHGKIAFNPKTEVAYYAQELDTLDAEKSILENVKTADYPEGQLRTILGSFLFQGETVHSKVNVLSPGEKARVALCKLLLSKANMLILDEPTNHLDPESQAIIGKNFSNFTGTIVVVSHNISFVEQMGITRMLVLPSGRIENYSPELLNHYYLLNAQGR